MNSLFDATCRRCGKKCLGRDGNPKAIILRRARQGECLECAVVLILKGLSKMHVGTLIPDPNAMLLPHVQQQFGAVLRAGISDAQLDEIDWERVVSMWDIGAGDEGKELW